MSVVGIDLGTTNSAVAIVNNRGLVDIINNDIGKQTTPSVVSFRENGDIIVGQSAKEQLPMYPTDTIDYYDRFTQLRFENEIDLERLVAEYYSKSEGLLEMVNDCRNKLFQLGNVENNYEEAINKIIRWNGKKC